MIGCGQGGKHKDDIFGFMAGYPVRFAMWRFTIHA
jgi:hypothetical protein